jgi:hypothetical protein
MYTEENEKKQREIHTRHDGGADPLRKDQDENRAVYTRRFQMFLNLFLELILKERRKKCCCLSDYLRENKM